METGKVEYAPDYKSGKQRPGRYPDTSQVFRRMEIRAEQQRLKDAVVEAAKAYGRAARAVEDHMKKSNEVDGNSAAGWQLLRDLESKEQDLMIESIWPLLAFEAEHGIGE